MGMNLRVFGVFAFGFLIVQVISRVIYGFFGGIYECVGDRGSFRFLGVSLGVSLRVYNTVYVSICF